MLHRERALEFRSVKAYGKVIQFRQSYLQQLSEFFRNFDWNERGVSINGNKLSNLRFADDVTIIAHDLEELELSLNGLSVASMQHALKINMAKTKVLRNKHVTQKASNCRRECS